MPIISSKKPLRSQTDQSARFIEAAKQIGADESGKAFERAMKKITKNNKKARTAQG